MQELAPFLGGVLRDPPAAQIARHLQIASEMDVRNQKLFREHLGCEFRQASFGECEPGLTDSETR